MCLPDEEFYLLEDDYLFRLERILPEEKLNGKQTKIFGWLLVLFGIGTIWRSSIRNLLAVLRTYVSHDFAEVVGNYLYNLPQFVVAAVLIVSGIRLILKKKSEFSADTDAAEQTETAGGEKKNGIF